MRKYKILTAYIVIFIILIYFLANAFTIYLYGKVDENNYVDYIIVTGGKAINAEFSDAYYAKQYATSKGVPEDVIFMEEIDSESVILVGNFAEENIESFEDIFNEVK